MLRTRSGTMPRAVRHAAAVATLLGAHAVRAGETTLAEPIVEENITDVDATRTGTIEVDLTGEALSATSTRYSGTWASEIEAEWRPVDRLGLGGGFGLGGPTSGISPSSASAFTSRVAASYVFVRDRERRIFLQGEASARRGVEGASLESPLESALPYTFGLRWATAVGPFTLRSAVLGEAGDAARHAPLRQSEAVLLECFDHPARLYVGAELIQDWARQAPFALVPEVLLLSRMLGEPIRVGIGVPATLEAKERTEIGVAFRFVFEPDE